jgi:glyoxylase-like metal-dependent hydrolase (beta-lactamase superfamily II)
MAQDVSLHLFTSGTLTNRGVTVPVPFFLIRHPGGNVVVDGGNPLPVAREPHAYWGPLADVFEVAMTESEHCVAQLRTAGIDPSDVRYVVQTHLHIDHTGALGHFPQATVLVHERELAAAHDPSAQGYLAADFERDVPWETLAEETDLFGDGAVRTIFSPGHSAGHTSLLVTLPTTGAVLLTGDASDTRRQFDGLDHPRVLHSREEAAASLERLRALAAETDALVIPGHDAATWARLERAYD